jgi:hypothetical protein
MSQLDARSAIFGWRKKYFDRLLLLGRELDDPRRCGGS